MHLLKSVFGVCVLLFAGFVSADTTITLQQGVDGYNGVTDSYIYDLTDGCSSSGAKIPLMFDSCSC